MSAYNQERLIQVLVSPYVSEKTTYVTDKRSQIVFTVLPDATKPEIKAAVESLFSVKVKSVQVTNLKGKVKRVGSHTGHRRNRKKAYICLENGQEIDFMAGRGGV